MTHTQHNTQSTRTGLSLAWVLLFVFAPSLAWAGGGVEELRTASFAITANKKNATSTQQGANDVKEAPPSAVPTATTKPTKKRPELVSLFYDPVQKHTVIRWKAFVHEGQRAVQYHIYRWTLTDPTRRLIAKVNGNVFEFIDEIQTTIGEVYFYDIVGIYHIDGKYQSWQYPSKKMLPEKLPTPESKAPQAGIGCSTLQQDQPKDGWLWLLALPLLFFFRKRRHDTTR